MTTRHDVHKALRTNFDYLCARVDGDAVKMANALVGKGYMSGEAQVTAMLRYKPANHPLLAKKLFINREDQSVREIAPAPHYRKGMSSSADVVWTKRLVGDTSTYSVPKNVFKTKYEEVMA